MTCPNEIPYYDDPVDTLEPVKFECTFFAGIMQRLIVWVAIGGSPNKIAARHMVLSMSLGISLGDEINSLSDIADYTGLSRSAISLMCKELDEQFGLSNYNRRKNYTPRPKSSDDRSQAVFDFDNVSGPSEKVEPFVRKRKVRPPNYVNWINKLTGYLRSLEEVPGGDAIMLQDIVSQLHRLEVAPLAKESINEY